MRWDRVLTRPIGRELSEHELQAASGGGDSDFTDGNELGNLQIGGRRGPLIERAGGLRHGLFSPDPDGDPAFKRDTLALLLAS